MMKNFKKLWITIIILSVFILFTSGGVYSAEKKIRTSIGGDPINFDPAHFSFGQDRLIAQQVLQCLVTFDVDTNPPHPIIPVLAKSYKISDDGKLLTFTLHEGVQFHQGYGEMTSEDVVFSIMRHLDPKVASVAKSQVIDIDKIETPDKYNVKIYLKNSSALTLIQNLAWQNAGFILSKKAYEKLGSKMERMMIGTGPFYFDNWDSGEKVILKKFEKYWRTIPKIDVVEFWIIPEEIVGLGALEKGDLDVAPVSQLGSYERAKNLKNISIKTAKGNVWQYPFIVNFKMKPMDDIRVRRALAHALDVKGICSRIGPLVVPFPSPLAPAVFAATDEFWKYDYNVEKAKKLLTEAGYPNGFELRLIYNKAVLYEPITLEVKNYWDKIVNVKLELVERAVYSQRIKQYNHHVAGWGIARTAPYLYAEWYETGSGRNYGQYSNPKIDEIISNAKNAKNEEEAQMYWRDFQKEATDDLAIYIPAVGGNVQAVSNTVNGLKLYPYTGLLEFENVSLSK